MCTASAHLWGDVLKFNEACRRPDLARVRHIYRGDFLADIASRLYTAAYVKYGPSIFEPSSSADISATGMSENMEADI